MMKIKIGLLILVALVIAAVVTCPSKHDHKTALAAVVKEYMDMKDAEVAAANPDGGLSPRYNHDKFEELSRLDIMNMGFDQLLEVNDYYVFSVGMMPNPQGYQRVSVGVFGHVFTPSIEDISRAAKRREDAVKIPRA